jgi:predicted nucleotidyltransferase
MLIETLRAQRETIPALSEHYGARYLRVFGSVARCKEGPDSEVDFLVEFPRSNDRFGQRLPLTEHLSNLLGRRMELIPEHELNRHIRDQILKEAVEL